MMPSIRQELGTTDAKPLRVRISEPQISAIECACPSTRLRHCVQRNYFVVEVNLFDDLLSALIEASNSEDAQQQACMSAKDPVGADQARRAAGCLSTISTNLIKEMRRRRIR